MSSKKIKVGDKVFSFICRQRGWIERIDRTGFLIKFSKHPFDYWFHYLGEFQPIKEQII